MNKLNVLNVSDANKFAFIKGNRPTDEKAIKVKKDSISEHGILCPITAVNGEEVIKSNGHLTDLDGNDIADEHAKDYYAVLDGQHRLKAYLELGLPLEDLVVIEPLNKKDCHCITHCRNEHLHENVERFRLHGSPRNGH